MAVFPKTSVSLIDTIKALPPGQDEAAWIRMWDLYAPAIQRFAAYKGGERNAEDILMRVFAKLVDVLRSGMYDPAKGAFHSYLAQMVMNEIHMQHRRDEVRHEDAHVRLDQLPASTLPAAAAQLDDDWQRAVLNAATEHVLTKTALSQRDRDIYRLYVQEGRPIGDVAEMFGLTRNNVSQIKTRIERRIADVGREMSAC